MSHLPVTIGESPIESGLYFGAFEGGKGDHGPAADRRPIGGGRQDRRKPVGFPDRAEGGDSRFTAERIRMCCGNSGQGGDERAVAGLAGGEAGCLDHARVVIPEELGVLGEEGSTDRRRQLTECSSHDRRGIGCSPPAQFGSETAHADEGAEGGSPHARALVAQQPERPVLVPCVAGEGGPAPTARLFRRLGMQGFIFVSSHDEESLETPDVPAMGAPGPAGDQGGRKRRFKRWHVFGGIGAIVVVAVLIASLITIPYYALTPGQAQAVGPLIDISPRSVVHSHKGSLLLVDVEETEMRAIDWIYFKLDNNATIIKSSEILGPETPAQNNTEGVVDMSDAQQAATVVALDQLGYHVKVVSAGALLYALLPGSPAETDLAVGDIVTAVGSRPVTSAQALSTALAPIKPGQTAELTVKTLSPAVVKRVSVTLGTWRIVGPKKTATLGCFSPGQGNQYQIAVRYPNGALGYPQKGKAVQPVACLGVLQVENSYTIGKLPFNINLKSEGIVGPSAGLAFTLGLMQELDPEDLTGGHKVAATGTMAINGAVGAIGGIKQKTIAVRASGASLFLVPPSNYGTAKAYAGSSLHVVAVSSIGQAISALERFGGKLQKVGPGH